MRICRLPKNLILHLKRFKQTAGAHTNKVTEFIRFPLKDLQLSKFTTQVIESDKENLTYELVAVSNHFGSLSMGHYTAYARDVDDDGNKTWNEYDDSKVRAIKDEAWAEDSGRASSAYVLFYK